MWLPQPARVAAAAAPAPRPSIPLRERFRETVRMEIPDSSRLLMVTQSEGATNEEVPLICMVFVTDTEKAR
ncbi:hypothetical protein GCM10010260_66670 [Streptomyces filipinensis]|uniref:Uncharacterized protein n=1 Tax=Streptomyces filipinensis TaxID=66887 RepID=A0A918MF20_9ACTN|nr:hypothetical protein GCM10010260_66670 [Streptomyces filipinensis]